jgi:RimJ/RimL family protein N-acetyltransferase
MWRATRGWTTDYSEADGHELVAAQRTWDMPPDGEWMQLGMNAGVELVGDLAVHRLADQPGTLEFGVTLDPEHSGRGYATEGARALIDALVDGHDAHRVVAFCDARNASVARVFQRLGLRHESRQVEADWFKGEWTTLDGWAVLGAEWRERRDAR